MKLGVMDFRYLLGVFNKEKSTVERPYFYNVLTAMQKKKKPLLEDIPVWLFIFSDQADQAQALYFVEGNKVLNTYSIHFADYYLAKFERLGDFAAANAKTQRKILLLFLQSPTNNVEVKIDLEFHAPNTAVFYKPRGYNELAYRFFNTELRMEFYLWVVSKFCKPGEHVFFAFSGGKFTCAAQVRVYLSI